MRYGLCAVSRDAEGDISGTVSVAINQLPDSPKLDRPGIQEWPNCYRAPNLNEEDKETTLEQLNQLAEAGKNQGDRPARMLRKRGMKKAAKRAMQMLTGIFAGLPALTKLVETSKSVLPALSQFFGL